MFFARIIAVQFVYSQFAILCATFPCYIRVTCISHAEQSILQFLIGVVVISGVLLSLNENQQLGKGFG